MIRKISSFYRPITAEGNLPTYTAKELTDIFDLKEVEIKNIAKKNEFKKHSDVERKKYVFGRDFYHFMIANYKDRRYKCWS